MEAQRSETAGTAIMELLGWVLERATDEDDAGAEKKIKIWQQCH